jgi:hypothetical protein
VWWMRCRPVVDREATNVGHADIEAVSQRGRGVADRGGGARWSWRLDAEEELGLCARPSDEGGAGSAHHRHGGRAEKKTSVGGGGG